MKNRITFRDVELLSASLDGNLSRAEAARLRVRMETQPGLAAVQGQLRQARAALRRTPTRHVPRNFTLTPKMAGVKPPVPRVVPIFSWASAVAALLFIFTLGSTFVGRLSFGAAAPMMAAPPGYGVGGGPVAESVQATEAPAADNGLDVTPTPEILTLLVPESTPAPDERGMAAEETAQTKTPAPLNPWLLVWPGVALVSVAAAVAVRQADLRAFRRRAGRK